jgi:predicted ArsR family transcriptional regulator
MITLSGQALHTTRRAVLEALKSVGAATVAQLSEIVGVKAITIRHHLNVLLAEKLVEAEEKRQTVGRPLYSYRLTPEAENLFPQKYHQLVERLLDQVKASLPPDTVDMLIKSLALSLAEGFRRDFEQLPEADRLNRLIELLAGEGFMAQWRRTEDGLELVEYHCPYYAVGQRHPEICQIDEELIRVALHAQVAKESCLLSGDSACKFVLTGGENALSSVISNH